MSRPRHTLFAASLLGLTLALSGCIPDSSSDEPEPAPETVTVTQTAPADDRSSAEASPEAAEDSPEGDGDDSAEASGQASEAADSDAAAKPAADASGLSERGNIPKQIGEEASLTASSGEKALSFEVTDIQPHFQCTSPYAEAPGERVLRQGRHHGQHRHCCGPRGAVLHQLHDVQSVRLEIRGLVRSHGQ